jgi:hypothetical protein
MLRRDYYVRKAAKSQQESRASVLRRGDMSFHCRVLEFIELCAFTCADIPGDQEADRITGTPFNTNCAYWGIRSKRDWFEIKIAEWLYFAAMPDFVSKVGNILPWLMERGWITSSIDLMARIHDFQSKKPEFAHVNDTNAEILKHSRCLVFFACHVDIITDGSWVSRKPGVVLRDRPRVVFETPAEAQAARTSGDWLF